jgi:hypothetical protein
VLGGFLRWRHARTTLQVICLALAALILLDGFFGPRLAPRNLAGVIPWVHWRGFVVLSLLVVGNLFCMACPFMLPRRLAKRFLPADRVWPAALRSKWLAVGLLLVFFWAYEAFSLWSSPWLTAWVALTYFVGAFAVDGFFRGASFCRFVCPIGQFHFVNGMVSPFEVRARSADTCARCETKDCIRGRYAPGSTVEAAVAHGASRNPADPPGLPAPAADEWEGRPIGRASPGGELVVASSGQAHGRAGLRQSGCELALFQPRKEGNLDCTFCMECIHACPHDNVGILARSPLRDLSVDPVRSGVGRISRKPDLAALALVLVFGAFLNAFGMVEPVYALQAWASAALGLESHAVLVLLFVGGGLVLVPAGLVLLAAWAGRRLSGRRDPLVERASTYAWSLVPLGFGMWTAHYLFHLMIGALTIVPVVQSYLGDLGLPAGDPAWGLGPVVPERWLLPIELVFLQGGLLATLLVGYRIARREEGEKRRALRAFVPWAALATGLALVGMWLLMQPMEMRGTFAAG